MDTNNNISSSTILTSPNNSKRSSLSSRASKIPQKLAQSTFFSLKPSPSSLNLSGKDSSSSSIYSTSGSSGGGLSSRIGQMLFRQRTTSESVIKESRSYSTQSLDYSSQSLGRNSQQSRSLDIRKNEFDDGNNKSSGGDSNSLPTFYPKGDHVSIRSTFMINSGDSGNNSNKDNSNLTPKTPDYPISSPERAGFDSYYFSATAGSVTTATKEENSLFTPLSFSNSSVSSFNDNSSTPPRSPMSPILFHSVTAAAIKSVSEFADILTERCDYFLEFDGDMQYSHIREIEMMLNQTQLLINAVTEESSGSSSMNTLLKQSREIIENCYHSSLTIKEQEASIISVIKDIQIICQNCISLWTKSPSLNNSTTDVFKKEEPKVLSSIPTADEYETMKSDQIDENASWFRQHFVGKPYQTFIGSLQTINNSNSLPLIDIITTKDRKRPSTPTNISFNTTNTNTKPIPKRRNSKSLLNSFLSSPSSSSNNNNNNQPPQPQQEKNIGIISVIQERANDFSGPRNGAAAVLGSQYRIIIRSKEPDQKRLIIHEYMAKETQALLESRGESHKMDKMILSEFRRLRPFGNHSNMSSQSIASRPMSSFATTVTSESQNTAMSRTLRAAILAACPNIDLRSFKELSAESTIMAGLEKDLLKYDEIHIPKHYKFGVLTIKNNQTTEEAWFANTGLSDDLRDFLNIMGTKVELKGYQGYAAGLDTKTGESGEFAYVSKWNDFDIMFHVAPLMPSHANDKQQVLRKKHIGNDIVCIIYLEGDQPFNPKAIRSQFLHVYIIVRRETANDEEEGKTKQFWRVEVLSNKNVGEFGPSIPSPPIFHDDETLKHFLTLKLINAENAALKSEKFRVPNSKARLGLLSSHIETGLAFSKPQVVRSASTNRLQTKYNKSSPLSGGNANRKDKDDDNILKKRPKSVNNNKSTHQLHQQSGGSRLLREAMLDEEKRRVVVMASTDIPPMPTISRSTLLQDFKNNFTRKKSTSKTLSPAASPEQKKKVLRKSSNLKISSIPEDTITNGERSKAIDEEEMFVGKDINISSESFISEEQLFSITADTNKKSRE